MDEIHDTNGNTVAIVLSCVVGTLALLAIGWIIYLFCTRDKREEHKKQQAQERQAIKDMMNQRRPSIVYAINPAPPPLCDVCRPPPMYEECINPAQFHSQDSSGCLGPDSAAQFTCSAEVPEVTTR